MASKTATREVLRTLLGFDTDEINHGVFLAMLDGGICPTQFPGLGVEDCIMPPDTYKGNGCAYCWGTALHDKKLDREEWP